MPDMMDPMISSRSDGKIGQESRGEAHRYLMLYSLKPAFVRSLSGVRALLVRRGISANRVSLAALPDSFDVGFHWVITLNGCDSAPPAASFEALFGLLNLELPAGIVGEPCEGAVILEMLAMTTEEASFIESRDPGYFIRASDVVRTSSVYITDAAGNRHTATGRDITDITFELTVDPEGFQGNMLSGPDRRQRQMYGQRSAWPAPFTPERARAVVEWDARRVDYVPEIEPLTEAPATGLTVVWFECGLPEGGGATPAGDNCLDQTEEMRMATDALGWELVVIRNAPDVHTAVAARPFRESLEADGDIYFPRGHGVGGWTQSDVNGLIASGAEIIDNGYIPDLGPDLDVEQWNRLQIAAAPAPGRLFQVPLLLSWMYSESQGAFTFGAEGVNTGFDPRAFCAGCEWISIPECLITDPNCDPPGIPPQGSAEVNQAANIIEAVESHPEMTYLVFFEWTQDYVDAVVPAAAETMALVGAVDSTAWEGGTTGSVQGAPSLSIDRLTAGETGFPSGMSRYQGLERPWFLIDLAIRSLSSDEPIHTYYAEPPHRLYHGNEDVATISDAFRQAFLEAWGVAP